jgi:hypothetical protein
MGLLGLLFWQELLGKGPLWKDGARHQRHRCPRCKRLTNGRTCRHCGCKMDEFGNELSFPADLHDPESW